MRARRPTRAQLDRHEASAIARRFQSPWATYSQINKAVAAALRRARADERERRTR